MLTLLPTHFQSTILGFMRFKEKQEQIEALELEDCQNFF